MVTRLLRRIAVAFARVGAFFTVLFLLIFGWTVWEVRNLNAFCDAMVPGTAVSAIPDLAKKHGFTRLLGGNGEKGKPGSIVVPTVTLFSSRCEIKHDGSAVIAAELGNP